MAVTPHLYTQVFKSLTDKLMDFDTDTIFAALFTAYTPAVDTHQFFSDVTGAGTQASGTGYTAGGQALTTLAFTRTAHVWALTADPVVWTTSTIAGVNYAVFYDHTPATDATRPVLGYWDMTSAPLSSSGASLTLTPNASGYVTFTGSG